jgi:nucleoside-diphosphate-sugar epimerase
MRVLVTGASGYIGRHALVPLLATGDEIHAVSRSPAHHDPPLNLPPDSRITWHAADLLDAGAPSALIEAVRPGALLHLAWNTTPGAYWTAPDNREWQRATVDLFTAFMRADGRRFLGAGTCAEYEWGSVTPCHERTTPTRPATLYGQCKLETWQAIDYLAAQSGMSAAWGRIFHLFGSDEHTSRLVPSVALSLLKGEPALCTHGEQVRDFMDVTGVAGAFAALLASSVTGAVNIASGEPRRVKDVVLGISARLGRSDLVRLGARPTSEPPVVTADVSRLVNEVGWRPSRTFDQGLDASVEHWRRYAHPNR